MTDPHVHFGDVGLTGPDGLDACPCRHQHRFNYLDRQARRAIPADAPRDSGDYCRCGWGRLIQNIDSYRARVAYIVSTGGTP